MVRRKTLVVRRSVPKLDCMLEDPGLPALWLTRKNQTADITEGAVGGRQLEIAVGRQQRKLVTDANLGEQCVDGADLNSRGRFVYDHRD
jgi:hypothetical protein